MFKLFPSNVFILKKKCCYKFTVFVFNIIIIIYYLYLLLLKEVYIYIYIMYIIKLIYNYSFIKNEVTNLYCIFI